MNYIAEVQQYPKPDYVQSIDNPVFKSVLSLYFVWAFSPLIQQLLVNIVGEKERKLKQAMQTMGMRGSSFWVSWFLTYALVMTFIVVVTVALCWGVKVFEFGSPFVLFILLWCYSFSIIGFSFVLSPFFNVAKTAGIAGSLISILLSLVYLPLQQLGSPIWLRYVCSLVAPVALTLGLNRAVELEGLGVGMQFSNLFDGEFSVGASLGMIIFDAFLYLILAW